MGVHLSTVISSAELTISESLILVGEKKYWKWPCLQYHFRGIFEKANKQLYEIIWALCKQTQYFYISLFFFFLSWVLKSWPVVQSWAVCLGFPCEPLFCLLPQAVIQSWQQLGLFLCHHQAECSAQDAPPVLPWQQAWRWQRGGHCSCLCCQVLQGAPVGCCCAAAFAWRQVCSEERVKCKHFMLILHRSDFNVHSVLSIFAMQYFFYWGKMLTK